MAESSFFAIQKKVKNVIKEAAKENTNEIVEEIKRTQRKFVLIEDGGWDHRGKKANQCATPFVDAETGKVIFTVIQHRSRFQKTGKENSNSKTTERHKGNYEGTSQGMDPCSLRYCCREPSHQHLTRCVHVQLQRWYQSDGAVGNSIIIASTGYR
jgi:hypothetical protein